MFRPLPFDDGLQDRLFVFFALTAQLFLKAQKPCVRGADRELELMKLLVGMGLGMM